MTEIELKNNILEKYNKRLKSLREMPRLQNKRNKYRKRHINKIEKYNRYIIKLFNKNTGCYFFWRY